MEKIEYKNDKTPTWDERLGDRVRDRGTEQGIEWLVATAPLYGAINGYVRIPDDHPWHGKNYHELEDDVDVHGGLTFSDEGWIGFDTLHAGDIWPEGPDYSREFPCKWDKHWTLELVVAETKSLARQVAETR